MFKSLSTRMNLLPDGVFMVKYESLVNIYQKGSVLEVFTSFDHILKNPSEYLLCVQYCEKLFINTISFDFHNNPMRLSITQFHSWN